MKQSPANFGLVLAVKLYESLLFALPKDFRQNYAKEMTLAFRDCCIEAYKRQGFRGIICEITSSVIDLVINAVRERVSVLVNDKPDLLFLLTTILLAVIGGTSAAFADLHNDETPTPLLLVLVFGFVLGFIQPRVFWLTGLLVGIMVPAIHFLALVRGWQVNYLTDSSTPLWAFLALIPALICSSVGAGFRLILRFIWKWFN